MAGWIKLYTKMKQWEWFSTPTVLVVFIHLLVNANHKVSQWHGHTIGVGMLVTSVKSLVVSTGLSTQQVRTALEKLQSTNEITIKATNKYSIITICNYGCYQSLKGYRQQTKQQATQQTNNNTYRDAEVIDKDNTTSSITEKPKFTIPTVDEVRAYCQERHNDVDAESFVAYYTSNGWYVGRTKMKDWHSAVITWEKKNYAHKSNSTRRGFDVPANPNYDKPF